MDADGIVDVFTRAADAVRSAVRAIAVSRLADAGDLPTQYALDLVADAAALDALHAAGFRVMSEETGWTGDPGAEITVVVDPVDGSTNCSRRIPFWAISLAALDHHGLLVGYVRNQVTDTTYLAVRGRGATRDGGPATPNLHLEPSHTIVGHEGRFPHEGRWWQTRALGSAALGLCAVAGGELDAYVLPYGASPWDYMGAVLVCREAGVEVVDAGGGSLDDPDPGTRCRPVAAATRELLDEILAVIDA